MIGPTDPQPYVPPEKRGYVPTHTPGSGQRGWKITDTDVPFGRALRWCLTMGTAHFLTVLVLAPAFMALGLLVMAGIGAFFGPKDSKDHPTFFPKISFSTPTPQFSAPTPQSLPVDPAAAQKAAIAARRKEYDGGTSSTTAIINGKVTHQMWGKKNGIEYELDPDTYQPIRVAPKVP